MNNSFLIVGISGFLGKSLGRYIRENSPDTKVFGLDIQSECDDDRVLVCDINNIKEVAKFLTDKRPEYIFHFAGRREDEKEKVLESHLHTTKSLFESVSMVKGYRPRIIIPSSASEYGNVNESEGPVDEKTPLKPLSWYGFVKYTQTTFSLMYARNGFDVVIARIFNLAGYGTPKELSIGKFSNDIALIEQGKKEKIILTKGLDAKRDFLDISDACSAISAIARLGKKGEIYNICSGKSHAIRDLLKILIGYSDIKDIQIDEGPSRLQDIPNSVGSNNKLQALTGWKQSIDIEQSLLNTLNYYRKNSKNNVKNHAHINST